MVVYSRWCGELISDIQHCGAKRGLSPLARGTHERGTPGRLIVRFIPAGVGNSHSGICNLDSHAVYPRWRGELSTIYPPLLNGTGLSPLARGTLPLVSCRPRKNRFIPAGAGELIDLCPIRLCNTGLSPLARGTPIHILINHQNKRFIPAGAGNSPCA